MATFAAMCTRGDSPPARRAFFGRPSAGQKACCLLSTEFSECHLPRLALSERGSPPHRGADASRPAYVLARATRLCQYTPRPCSHAWHDLAVNKRAGVFKYPSYVVSAAHSRDAAVQRSASDFVSHLVLMGLPLCTRLRATGTDSRHTHHAVYVLARNDHGTAYANDAGRARKLLAADTTFSHTGSGMPPRQACHTGPTRQWPFSATATPQDEDALIVLLIQVRARLMYYGDISVHIKHHARARLLLLPCTTVSRTP
ncbi:hypothetical protein THASP1DRAFT_22667 [Thamnocephalis sphaerospora]|uniref:Uncharacterized protein n=1 Tax=Thamnocephalis sphaerospora TaxID=78915 RepID=A0A4P9XTJ1_9FUNG|nr:hypothetical protein THASP1DRAFT_22667 [Thamnocephalis sphaerospora]|eukprot:RKP09504.1 hypothetical protein THASP1DRAFT_22667 [Thamnocephalis sphaerospora]